MAPVEVSDDFYEILRIPNTATLCSVTSSYRRLARETHPDKNPNDPGATAAFQLVSPRTSKLTGKKNTNSAFKLARAYETLKDPDARRHYDLIWARIRSQQTAKQEAEKRQAKAKERDRERKAEEQVKTQKEKKARLERLQNLEAQRSQYENEIFELTRQVRRIKAQVKRLKEQDDEDLRKERARSSWWAYVTPSAYTQAKETEEEKQLRESEALQRLNSKRIHESSLHKKEAWLQKLNDLLQDANTKITAEKKEEEDEAEACAAKAREEKRAEQERRWQEQERLNREQEELRRKQEQERWERLWKEQADRDARENREFQERVRRAREASEQQERIRKAEAEAEAARARRCEKNHRTQNNTQKPASRHYRTTSTCLHDKFWPRREGSQLCSNCHQMQRRFAFQCPDCSMIACANCRQAIRGERKSTR